MRLTLSLLALFIVVQSPAQTVILGGRGSQDIEVFTSSDFTPTNAVQSASGHGTINGNGLEGPLVNASRFLSQAAFGGDLGLIRDVAEMGIEPWLDSQIDLPVTSMLNEVRDVYEEVIDWYLMQGGDSSNVDFSHPYWNIFSYAWWNLNMYNEDIVRQRVAFALSQIFVISIQSNLDNHSYGLGSFYDVLARNSFGNYRDLLLEVTLHPCMGFYLSHLNNPKADPGENIHPDENYAREVQQLFSIGLYELNQDGSRKTNGQGDWIPTYGQTRIKEFAKVFTGLGVSDVIPNMYTDEAEFGEGIYIGDLTKPMRMYDEWHQQGEKVLHNGFVIPDGQSGMQDIEDAIDNLFNHPNVGPFISQRLIQFLVTSNPSPQYISRIAGVFNDNGQGVRGDLGAVIKAILLDDEARSCDSSLQMSHGKLREPYTRFAHFAAAMNIEQYYGRFWHTNYRFMEDVQQIPLGSPSVFNFFLPDHRPLGPISDQGLVAPEFQIHNSRTSVNFMNEVNGWAVWQSMFDSWEHEDPNAFVNYDQLKSLANSPEALVNRLDVLFTHGRLTDRTRQIIKDAITPLIYGDYREERVELATYLIVISPDYAVLK